MNRYYPGGSYETRPETKRYLLDKLLLDTRFYLMGRFLYQGYLSRKKVLQGKYNQEEWAADSYNLLQSIERCGGHFILEGLEHLNRLEEPVVFVANHMSTLEALILPSVIAPFRKVTFVVKESLIRAPILGKVIHGTQPIVVGRENPREDLQTVMKEGVAHLSQGTSVVIFPQSTRSRSFKREAFNTLGVKLAKKAGVPILPLALKTDFWENGKLLKDLGPIYRDRTIYFAFGEPIPVEGTGKEAHLQSLEFIVEQLQRWSVPVE